MLRSAFLVAIGILVTGFISIFIVVMYPAFPRGEYTVHRLGIMWARFLLFIANVKVDVIGKENALIGKPQIFMANHQSWFDIFIVFAHIPAQFSWIAKKELFSIPFFGTALRRLGTIEIDRKHHASALKSIDAAAQKIRDGKSVVTFPEGTRSMDGEIQPFKKGVFHLALKSGVPIVPISIVGSREIMPKKSLKIHPGKIVMVIGEPIEIDGYSVETIEELITRVRTAIAGNYYERRAERIRSSGVI
ncbi:MAG: lysophospholipid acyltransferase family protein [Syntrophales bacterium]